MILTTILAALVVLLSTFPSGFLFSVVLLRKTRASLFSVVAIGFIFGFITTPTLTWAEAYLIPISPVFSFSLGLFEANAALLLIISLLVCFQQGAFKTFREDFLTPGGASHHKRKRIGTSNVDLPHTWVWVLLGLIVLSTFATRMMSIGITPTFFEFDPYFDMVDTQYILTYGQELLLDPSAWPAVPGGTNHRVEPLIPYAEAYWYDVANLLGSNSSQFSTTLLSDVSGIYPPIAAAMLVFVVFLLVYHEYNEYLGLIAASLTATMPVIFTTFIAGEQLVESWGIFALFFFLAAYLMAVKDPKNPRLAVFAGLAFVSNFIGAHYYTVTAGVLVIYILLQGSIDAIRGDSTTDFYKMNIIIIAVIAVFYAIYLPYSSTLQNRIPSILGVPLTLSGPVLALMFVAIIDYVPKEMQKRGLLFKELNTTLRAAWFGAVFVLAIIVLAVTPLGAPIQSYLSLSTKFTTPSSPLFMTVEEFIPTGLTYDFGSNGFGLIGSSTFGAPLLIWFVCGLATLLLVMAIALRRSRTAILYLAIALPLMFAGFSEVKYLPHFGVAYILLFTIVIGELMYYAEHDFKLIRFSKPEEDAMGGQELVPPQAAQSNYSYFIPILLSIGLFFVSTIIALAYLAWLAMKKTYGNNTTYIWAFLALLAVIMLVSWWIGGYFVYGESSTYIDTALTGISALTTNSSTSLCNMLNDEGDTLGATLYCNTVPQYWLNAMAWVKQNVGPNGPRVLAWWDYGDWINWFGNSNAYLRGDNANATEDYAFAEQYTQGSNIQISANSLARLMNGNQSKYIIFPEDDISKWGAIDFLGCINSGGTTYDYAVAQGQAQSPPQPYQLGTSQCEINNDPQYALLPYGLLVGNQSLLPPSINVYCSISNSVVQYIAAPLITGGSLSNTTACIDTSPNKNGVLNVYNQSGAQLNAYIQLGYSAGEISIPYQAGTSTVNYPYVEFLMEYTPDASNGQIMDAPSGFYRSNFYKGFFLGTLHGFTEVYPANVTGTNFLNGSWPVRIYELNDFNGTLPTVPVKPSYISNNYTMP